MFQFLLQSIIDEKVPESSINQIEYFNKNFIAHSYLYWNSRKEKKYFRAFFESFYCAYLANEEKNFIHGLLSVYPKDPILHKYFGESLLNLDGKFDSYKKEIAFSIQLQKQHNSIIDPLLHSFSLRNPKVLQFYNSELHLSLYSSNSSSEANSIKSNSIFQRSHKKEKKNKEIASKIVRSKRKIPYLHILHYVLPALMILGYTIYTSMMHNKDIKKSRILEKSIEYIDQSFNNIASSVLVHLSLSNFSSYNSTNETICQINFYSITRTIENYINAPITSNLGNSIVNTFFHEIKKLVLISNDICFIVNNFDAFLNETVCENIQLINDNLIVFIQNFENVYQSEKSLFKVILLIIIGSVILIIFLIIYFIVNCVAMNKIMSENKKAIDYLSSERRLIQIFQRPELRESLWYTVYGIESSVNNSDSSVHFDNESDLNTASSTLSKQTNSNPSQKYKLHNIRPTSSATHILKPQLIPPSNFNFNENDTNETNQEKNKIQRIALSKSSISGSTTNFASKNMIPKPPAAAKNSLASVETDSLISDTNNAELELQNINENPNESGTELSLNLDANDDYISSLMLNDDNSISEFLSKKKKDTNIFSIFTFIIIILFPWILFYLLITFGIFPLKFRRKSNVEIIEKVRLFTNDLKNCFLLLRQTLNLWFFNEVNMTQISMINQTFGLRKTDLAELYFQVQCFQFQNIECLSVYSIVENLLQNNYTDNYLITYAIPLLANFTKVAIEKLYISSLQNLFSLSSSAYSFIFLTIFACIIFIIIGVVKTKSLSKGLNSLFHFPSNDNIISKNEHNSIERTNSNINEEQNNNNNNNEISDSKVVISIQNSDFSNKNKSFPSNVMIVTSVLESDEIYSISDTCIQIINKKPSEMICRKLSRIFPLVKMNDDFEIREHNGKTFISKTKTIGKLSKTVLIEASKTEVKNKSNNASQKLINFMPFYFVKPFSEEFINYFHFDKSILIFIRINSKVTQIESFFTIINRLDQSFFNIDFIRSNGSVITFICKEIDSLEIVLFLRDLITSCEESCKRQMNNFALKSIYICSVDELNVEIVEGNIEPENRFEEKVFYELEKLIYYVDDLYIGCNDEIFSMLNSIGNFKKIVFKNNINVIHFKVFNDEISNKL